MIKYICDKCLKETPPENIQGNFSCVVDAKLKTGKKEDYCKDCVVKIVKAIKDIK